MLFKKKMFDFGSYDVSTRLKAKSLLAASAVGGGSGIVAAAYGAVDSGMLTTAFLGLLLVVIGGHVGGFLGLMVRSLYGAARGGGGSVGDAGTDAIMPTLAFGSLLGLVFTLIFGKWGWAHFGAAIGAAVGGMAGGLAGEDVGNMLRLLLSEEGQDGRARRRSKSGRIELEDYPDSNEDEK